ncbi:MAG: hypothetical protein KAV87_00600 [Desulfobacteraceae bacterium]|nr:hypothetical protein [Desulfobacteraceae bacterium]
MKQQNLLDNLPQRYNRWCQRRPLVCANQDQYRQATSFFTQRGLSPSEQAAFYLHELTGCAGFEFVAFSNVRLEGPVRLPNSVVLVPCFLDTLEGRVATDPLVQLTIRMQHKSRLIYDGWVPIAIWDEQNVRRAIQSIDEALSVFCLSSGIFFDWNPKYPAPNDQRSTYEFEEEHLKELEILSQTLDTLEEDDRTAIYRSLAWLSQGIRLDEPAARFLFSILAIESLATYIEETAPDSSPLTNLRTKSITEAECEKCIKDALKKWLDDDPRKAIERAYFDCVTSITARLKRHLQKVLASDAESYNLIFREKVEGKTLYDIRHYVAHGSLNALSEVQREQIRQRVWDAERVARRYIWAVLEQALNIAPITTKMNASLSIRVNNMVVSSEKMYKGPTHMAEIYSQ